MAGARDGGVVADIAAAAGAEAAAVLRDSEGLAAGLGEDIRLAWGGCSCLVAPCRAGHLDWARRADRTADVGVDHSH